MKRTPRVAAVRRAGDAARRGAGEEGRAAPPARRAALWELRLYVAGSSPRCVIALRNLERLCEQHLAGKYRIEVVDLLENPKLARGDQILAIPTLVRKLPQPMKKIIGDLSNEERVLVGLDLRPLERVAP